MFIFKNGNVNSSLANLALCSSVQEEDRSCIDLYTHLGIIVNSKGPCLDHTRTAHRRGKNSFYAFTNIGSLYDLNPLTLAKLYKSVTFPSILNG